MLFDNLTDAIDCASFESQKNLHDLVYIMINTINGEYAVEFAEGETEIQQVMDANQYIHAYRHGFEVDHGDLVFWGGRETPRELLDAMIDDATRLIVVDQNGPFEHYQDFFDAYLELHARVFGAFGVDECTEFLEVQIDACKSNGIECGDLEHRLATIKRWANDDENWLEQVGG